jgi:hypothetical protein
MRRELLAARNAQMLDELAHMHEDMKQTRASMDAIEGHLWPVHTMLQEAVGRSVGSDALYTGRDGAESPF